MKKLDQKPDETLFGKFASGELKPSKIVYEDDRVLAFEDIDPQAPVLYVIISKVAKIGQVHNAQTSDISELGYLLYTAGEIAKQQHCLEGYRLVINQGLQAQQSVNYVHVHMLAKRQFHWPPG